MTCWRIEDGCGGGGGGEEGCDISDDSPDDTFLFLIDDECCDLFDPLINPISEFSDFGLSKILDSLIRFLLFWIYISN